MIYEINLFLIIISAVFQSFVSKKKKEVIKVKYN